MAVDKMDHVNALKLGVALVLVAVVGIAAVSAIAQSYALPPQGKGQNGKGGYGDHSDHGLHEDVKAEHGNGPHWQWHPRGGLGASSVVIGKTSIEEEKSVTVLTRSLRQITVEITNETEIVKNGGTDPDWEVMLSRLAVGDRVRMHFREEGDDSYIATFISAYTPAQLKAKGVVVNMTSESITIETHDGGSLTFKVETSPTSPYYTVVEKAGVEGIIDDVEAGDHIHLDFIVQPDGTLSAVTIHAEAEE